VCASRYTPADRWADSAEYREGVELFNLGHPWEAHEAWESLWQAAGAAGDAEQRQFLQGLIQCAAACVKVAKGQLESSRRLAARGLARLRPIPGMYMGLDVPAFVAAFDAWVAAGGRGGAPPTIQLAGD
jgi:predicted metal-dependent hydrolase